MMRTLVFLGLLAAALAHWPYPDMEEKFRVSSLSVLGAPENAIDNPSYKWIFSPLNNQLQPTFLLTFPHAPQSTSNTKEGLVYTFTLDHLAEVVVNGGTFKVVAGSTIYFDKLIWFTDTFDRYYDSESMGEVIEFEFWSYGCEHLEHFLENKMDTMPPVENLLYPVTIHVSVFPDSSDDIIDVEVYIQDYEFMVKTGNTPGSHLGLFFTVSSSGGEDPYRNVPNSMEYKSISFELDPDVAFMFESTPTCTRKRNARNTVAANISKSNKHHDGKVKISQKNARKLGAYSKRMTTKIPSTNNLWDHTSNQVWISSGYVASVLGVLPDDLVSCVRIITKATISLRTYRPQAD